MITKQTIERFELISQKSFTKVVDTIKASIGRPNMQEFLTKMAQSNNFSELERTVNENAGNLGLMQFMQLDLGEVLRSKNDAESPNIVRFIIGNPLIMAKLVAENQEAGLYAPVTILICEQADGVHLLYDKMTSHFAVNENSAGYRVARNLDEKVESLLSEAAEVKNFTK